MTDFCGAAYVRTAMLMTIGRMTKSGSIAQTAGPGWDWRGSMKVTQCQGEGQGSCKRCSDKGKWNRTWMCFLYKIEGYDGCYCADCVKEIKAEVSLICGREEN